MYFRLYKIRLKCLIRNYDMLFWSIAFPILLSLFFYLGFYNLFREDNIKTIPVAVVKEERADNGLLKSIQYAKIDEETPLFELKIVTRAEGEYLLKNKEVEGIIINREKPALIVNNSGYNQTIIKSFLDDYLQVMESMEQTVRLTPSLPEEDMLKILTGEKNYIINGSSSKSLNSTLIYFYTLIALACMFGSIYGLREMRDIEANQSAVAARLQVAPIHKFKLLICNMLAALTMQFSSIILLLLFLNKVLMVDFGGEVLRLAAVCLLGSLCGITLGAMVCVVVKANIKVRSAILYVIVLGGGLLSGMMMVDIKYLISQNVPLIAFINPSNLITDAFYSLYFYEGYDRYLLNLSLLGLLTGIFTIITYLEIRRKDYASI